ncbi:Eukaryotic translation initiation factor 4 gamma [Leucoagaricus sp. SymC.cos]|nr:Eukaryotic translation initiation factor 4 gamma [Leucoagaricus sp. SymC.cos]
MNRPSTAQISKNPTIPRNSAWYKGPPQSSAPSRSQSPAPSTPIVQTHSRRPSALSGVSIKDGVSVNRNNVGAAKQGSAVTFGSIDDISAPISSSPAAAPSIKSESVKSFGTIDAETHVNGKSALSSRPSVAVPTSTTSSSTPSPAVSVAPAAKLAKTDIAKLFQNPSSAPSPQPSSDASSPSLRSAGLPSSQSTPSSQTPQSSAPTQPSHFTPYRHPQPGTNTGASRSPAYSTRQVANGTGPRSQGGPNGAPSQMNTGMPSPRLAPMSHNGQPPAMPPPPQMQPSMGQQMPVAWGGYYYPGVPDQHYYPQPQWYHPPPHPPPPGGPHGPPHAGMPISSPRNPPIGLQGGPGTPTLSHATATPVHQPHPPPPITHPSTSMGNITSPPPTPSSTTSRLNANSSAFAPRPRVVIKKADGTEVNIENLKPPTSSSPANNVSTNGQASTFRQGSPGTLNRRSVRLETPEQQEKAVKAKEAEEAAKTQQAKEDGEIDEPQQAESTPTPKEKSQAKEPLRINTSEPLKKRPERLDLSNTGSVPAPLPSALATARIIDDLSRVQYPEGISSPNPELNANAKDGKFRYDRDFLLQFMAICKEKPDSLPPLDAIGLEPIDQASLAMHRTSSGRHRQASGPSAPSRQGSIGLGIGAPSGFGKPSGLNPFAGGGMGNFQTAPKLTSEERFQLSTSRSASVGGPAGMPFGRPVAMQRTPSQGGPGGMSSNRTRSQRGKQRDGGKMAAQQAASAQATAPANFEPIVPLKVSENRWNRKAIQVDNDSPEAVDRKVRGLLNKLTMERFDSISDQIIEWANKSEKEKDGRTLIQVIRLVFEKATDEATWSEMYARLCRKMMEQISNKVQDDGIKNQEGKPIAGGQLFRKYLLNRCQEDFERGWVAKEATAAAAATKAMEDEAVKAANDKKEGEDGEVALYSDEYYAAQKAKRQGLGLIKFIGELFKLQMLTERIMHECVKKLLGNVNNPEEEEIESLCKLLTTVGSILDTPKAHAHMDVYFRRMRELTESPHVSPRMQFMLQDVIELRERKWVARNAVAAPATIAQIHEAAAKEKAAQEKEYSQRQISMSRGGSRRGHDRNEQSQVNPEGWAVAGNATRPPSKGVDLSNFGKISKAIPVTFGPSSVFAGKKDKRESLSRTSSSSNMFSMLQNAESGADKTPEAQPQRRKLALLPRTKPIEAETQQQQESSEDEEVSIPAPAAEMSEEVAEKKIKEDLKEFFAVRNLDEAEVYFTALPTMHHSKLVDKLVSSAVESKEADAKLVADLFTRAVSKNLCSQETFEQGFVPCAEIIDDVAIDAPKAFQLFAIMVKGAELDEERRSRLASKSMDDKLLALLS